jgi:hypothetical protein
VAVKDGSGQEGPGRGVKISSSNWKSPGGVHTCVRVTSRP